MKRVLAVSFCGMLLTGLSGCSGWGTAATAEPPSAEVVKTEVSAQDAPGPFITTNTGLKYRILKDSDGRKPRSTDSVLVHYQGWLDDGTVFDTTYKTNKPARFPVSGVVPGFGEGLQKIGVGGTIELDIPARLGYGARGAGDKVPPNATLHFRVELLDVQ